MNITFIPLKTNNLAWGQRKGMPKVPSMLFLKPHLFAITDGGVATCPKATTSEIVWQERLGGNSSASPISAEGRIYFVSDEDETNVVEAGRESKVLAKNPLGEKLVAEIVQRLAARVASALEDRPEARRGEPIARP